MKSTGRRKYKKQDNLSKWTIAAALYIVGWSVTFFIAWCVLKMEPSVLEGCILAPGVVELVMSAVLKLGKNKKEIQEQQFYYDSPHDSYTEDNTHYYG